MSYSKKITAFAPMVLGLSLTVGCGESSNTVELPATPAPAPSSGPADAGPADAGNAVVPATSTATAPPAMQP